jgi:hypothetical protein
MATTTQFPNPDEAPRGRRFADPSADIVWAAIETLDEAAKHEVFSQLRGHLAVPDARQTDEQARVAKSVAALREPAAILAARGDSDGLSTSKYEALRREDRRRKSEWPPESSIRRFVAGTWNDALRRAQLEPVVDGDAIVVSLGGRFTREECTAAVRDCSNDLNDPLPGFADYLRWSRRPDVRRRAGRRPASQPPFDRIFNGWTDVLVAAGLAQPGQVVARRSIRGGAGRLDSGGTAARGGPRGARRDRPAA